MKLDTSYANKLNIGQHAHEFTHAINNIIKP
jgi:hypothetical protein